MDEIHSNKTSPAPINMKRVGEMESVLKRQTTFQARFRFNMTEEEAEAILAASYKLEVEKRQRALVLDENTSANLHKLAEFVTAERPKFGVMLCGTCGNGKSTLMRAFQRALNYLADSKHFSFMDKYFIPRMAIYDAWDLAQIAHDAKEFAAVKAKSMIGIDDLGNEPAEILEFGNPIYPIVRLIEHRYNTQAFTFITTNLTPKEIREKYGARIADRFNEMLHVIVFRDISYRN